MKKIVWTPQATTPTFTLVAAVSDDGDNDAATTGWWNGKRALDDWTASYWTALKMRLAGELV